MCFGSSHLTAYTVLVAALTRTVCSEWLPRRVCSRHRFAICCRKRKRRTRPSPRKPPWSCPRTTLRREVCAAQTAPPREPPSPSPSPSQPPSPPLFSSPPRQPTAPPRCASREPPAGPPESCAGERGRTIPAPRASARQTARRMRSRSRSARRDRRASAPRATRAPRWRRARRAGGRPARSRRTREPRARGPAPEGGRPARKGVSPPSPRVMAFASLFAAPPTRVSRGMRAASRRRDAAGRAPPPGNRDKRGRASSRVSRTRVLGV